ncbi:hypothetical protein LTR53_015606, partial [Teratosphaeriaceae sp. CCFEE 6253]
MRPSGFLLAIFRFLLPPTLIGVVYLYLYPLLQQCSFPPAKSAEAACHFDGADSRPAVAAEIAPFRLLALADPQLEGDTSLPDVNAPWLPSLARLREDGITKVGRELVTNDLARILQGYKKRLDLWGNDLYLAHIYRTVAWWTQPTHTVVLGDLLGSQWIGDEEFSKRSHRFWDVFAGGVKVPPSVTDVSGRVETLGGDDAWKRRVIAVAGNHDIGYAGDIDEHRVERFEAAFGSVNWDIRFRLDTASNKTQPPRSAFSSPAFSTPPELRLVILNSMNLNEPTYKPQLRQQSLDFLASQLREQASSAGTILLTHIPLHKDAGICVDAPYFSYFPDDQGGGIREQNHLSQQMSSRILAGLLPSDESGSAIVLNGHDHEGCDTHHHRRQSAAAESHEPDWQASRFHVSRAQRDDATSTGLREITVRSMMGSYSGNAGLLSAWFDPDAGRWRFEY